VLQFHPLYDVLITQPTAAPVPTPDPAMVPRKPTMRGENKGGADPRDSGYGYSSNPYESAGSDFRQYSPFALPGLKYPAYTYEVLGVSAEVANRLLLGGEGACWGRCIKKYAATGASEREQHREHASGDSRGQLEQGQEIWLQLLALAERLWVPVNTSNDQSSIVGRQSNSHRLLRQRLARARTNRVSRGFRIALL
jgi:hypothetical protein